MIVKCHWPGYPNTPAFTDEWDTTTLVIKHQIPGVIELTTDIYSTALPSDPVPCNFTMAAAGVLVFGSPEHFAECQRELYGSDE